MKGVREKLLTAFEAEHKDHLEAVRAMLDAHERALWDGAALDTIELHRRLHSLKGAARAVDMRPVEKLAHALESLIEDCQAGAMELDADAAAAMRQALDAIEDWVSAALARQHPPALDAVIGAIAGVRAGVAPAVAAPSEAPGQDAGDKPDPGAADAAPAKLTRIETRSFNALIECSSEIIAAMGVQDAILADIRSVHENIQNLGAASARRPRQFQIGADGRRRRSETGREHFSIGLLQASATLQAAIRRQRAHAWRIRRLGRAMQRQVGLLQMVAAETVFGATGKIVRDIAREQGKRVRTDVRGLETVADRAVLQSLKDPVIHLLRNAVNHGVETPEERARLGKPDTGIVALEVSTRGAELIVKVEDDGRGVDREHVLRLARRRGLVEGAAGAEIGDEYLTALLCEPGFSTAETVTEVAGRGMGLSVVREAVTQIGGAFSIAPRSPQGTRVVITAPSSLLAMRFVLVETAGQIACIPANRTLRVHNIEQARVETVDGRAHAIKPGAPPMALAPLSFLLGRGEAELAGPGRALAVVELANAGARIGVVVDAVVGVRDGVMRDLEFSSEYAGCVSGGVILDAGAVAPVLDASALIAAFQNADARCVMRAREAPAEARRRSILVVDDSITTRTLEKSVLEANGYDVQLSVDGADALKQLRLRGADLVVSDVEMPRLDGFGLLAAMKKDPALSRIPFVLVTSRSDDADQRRGLNLGADAYIVKQRFDQAELLSIIGRLL